MLDIVLGVPGSEGGGLLHLGGMLPLHHHQPILLLVKPVYMLDMIYWTLSRRRDAFPSSQPTHFSSWTPIYNQISIWNEHPTY